MTERSGGVMAVATAWIITLWCCSVAGAFWAGRMVERSEQLGQVIRLQIVERDAWEAVRALDSISMRYQIAALRGAQVKHFVQQSRK